jgi:hypothetical protein
MSPKGKSGKGKGAAAASGSNKDKKVDISKRPAKEDLVDKGIIKGNPPPYLPKSWLGGYLLPFLGLFSK